MPNQVLSDALLWQIVISIKMASFNRKVFQSISFDMGMKIVINWEDVVCPICLDCPHNGVLLLCSSYDKGCRPFMCDTDRTHSNCLERFKIAHGFPPATKSSSLVDGLSDEKEKLPYIIDSNCSVHPTCPLCRGDVLGWLVVDEARMHLDVKKRCCEVKSCTYVGNYIELQKHAQNKHPHSRPAEIDPARKLDWENFQQSSDIIDVLSIIHSEVPHGVILGDYVIEYGEDGLGDEYENFNGNESRWWSSCLLYQIFDNFRSSRSRRRSRKAETRRGVQQPNYGISNMGSHSSVSADTLEYRFDEIDDEFAGAERIDAASSGHSGRRRSWRRRSRFRGH